MMPTRLVNNITPEAFRPRAPRDETVRTHSRELWQRPPNFAAGIQSLSFNQSRWHPAASYAVRSPPEPDTGRCHCSVENPLRRLRGLSSTELADAEVETAAWVVFCLPLLCACNNPCKSRPSACLELLP